MKIKCIYWILIYFTILLNVAYGQSRTMPVTTTLKTPYGSVPYTHYMPSMQNYYTTKLPNGLKYEFYVVMNNDSAFRIKTKIHVQEKGSNFITVKGRGTKGRIYPSDTKLISRRTYEGKTLKGIPADTCWLFLVDKGAINSYSFYAEMGTSFVIAIQEGDDNPIVPLTKENLLPMIGGDAKANKHASKDDLLKAIAVFNQHKAKEVASKIEFVDH